MRVFIAISVLPLGYVPAAGPLATDHGGASRSSRPRPPPAGHAACWWPADDLLGRSPWRPGEVAGRTAEQLKPGDPAQAAWSVRCRPAWSKTATACGG